MKYVLFIIFNFFLIHDSTSIRLELNYDKEAQELQIHVDGKEKIEHVLIYAGEKLLVEFDSEQVPPWDSTIRLRISCPTRCKFYYVIQTKDGTRYSMKSRKIDLNKNGGFYEIELPKKN